MSSHDDNTDDKLRRRIARLEDRIDDLEEQLDEIGDDDTGSTAGSKERRPLVEKLNAGTDGSVGTDDEQDTNSDSDDDWIRPENWVDKIGVALLLVGLAFLYRWSVEHGLVTPVVRVGFGLAIGTGLGIAGWQVRDSRHRLSQILLGAASVAYYIALFSAHHFYDLIPYSVAFGAMTGVVAATFIIANNERDPALAVVAAIGGFATPLLLSSDGNIPGLMTYNAILVLGMTAIYLVHGWRIILGIVALGAWAFVGYASSAIWFAEFGELLFVNQEQPLDEIEGHEQLYTQASLLITWFCIGVVPTVRLWLRFDPQRDADEDDEQSYQVNTALLLAGASAVAGFAFTMMIWDNPAWLWTGLSVIVVAAAAAVAYRFDGDLPAKLISGYRLLATAFAVVAFAELAPDGHFITAIAALAVAVHYLAARFEDRLFAVGGHALLAPIAVYLADTAIMAGETTTVPFLNAGSVQTLFVVASLVAITVIITRIRGEGHGSAARFVYRWATHASVLAYVYSEAVGHPDGDALVTAGWAFYAVALLVVGLVSNRGHFKYAGLVAVLATVAKLVLFDLRAVDTEWRILLFMGFGAVLVALSYFWPRLSELFEGDDETSG